MTTYTYDPAGEQTSVTDPTGAQTQATYDNLGHLLTATDLVRQNASAAYTTTYGYNDAGEQISQTSPTGVQPRPPTTRVGEQISTTDGAGNTTTYAYNLDGNLAKITLPDGTATTAELRPGRAPDLAGGPERGRDGAAHRVGRLQPATGRSPPRPTSWATPPPPAYDATGMLTSQTQPVSASAQHHGELRVRPGRETAPR